MQSWCTYNYKKLPMGVCNSLDIFQGKMNKLFKGFENICAYLNGLLVLMASDWTNHLENLEHALIKLQENGLKFNVEKSFFGQPEMEYLGFWVIYEGVNPTAKKSRPWYKWLPQQTKSRYVGLSDR